MALIAFLWLGSLLCGFTLAWTFLDSDDNGPWEQWALGLQASLILLVAANWLLSLCGILTPLSLFLTACAFTGIGIQRWGILSRWKPLEAEDRNCSVRTFLLCWIPVLLWTCFVLWRGWLLPPDNHDALAYHMPKAVLIMQHHGFGFVPTNDIRLTAHPPNYEFLIADILISTHADKMTAWVETICYLQIICLAAATGERLWGRGAPAWLLALASAGMPVILLHSGAQKNDLFMGCFLLGTMLWCGRGAVRDNDYVMAAGVLSWLAGFGTKPNSALFFPAILFPLTVWLWKRRRGSMHERVFRILRMGCVLLAGAILLGALTYVQNWRHTGTLVGYSNQSLIAGTTSNAAPFYGQWRNIWEFPAMLWLAPFSTSLSSVWVPWRQVWWHWPTMELYFSHFGVLWSALAPLLPIGIWIHFRPNQPWPYSRAERLLWLLEACACYLALAPVGFRTYGFFIGFPRIMLFLGILVPLCSLAPIIRIAREGLRWRWTIPATGFTLASLFIIYAARCAIYDKFSPLDCIVFAWEHPGARDVSFGDYRASIVCDKLAGPRDEIAFDGGVTDGWSYHLFGAHLTRKVDYLCDSAGVLEIPTLAKWVAIDRSWDLVWESPGLTDMSKYNEFVWRGNLKPEDSRVFVSLLHDPSWKLVYLNPKCAQAVFKRL